MNERIRELAEQAGFMVDQSGCIMVCFTSNGDSEAKKFAELIVGECAELSVNSQYANTKSEYYEGFNEALIYVGNKIKRHFGVEEPKGWVCPKCGVDRTKVSCPQGHTAAVEGKCPMIGVAQ